MNYSDENVALCALNKIFGYHPRLALDLMEAGGSALSVFDAPLPHVPEHPELAEQVNAGALEWARRELSQLDERGFRFLGLRDEDYPEALQAIPDPPLGLYLSGCSSPAEIFSLRPLVAFVGTRDISPYGKEWCRRLVSALADAPVEPVIVSGLAFGADGIAHRTALERGLPTIGVMATGIEKIYPWQHGQLASEMVRTPGCALVTDYPMGPSPLALNFLRRNRIIAGLVSAVVVVESKTRGGSLMTARYACEYGRDVHAVPGRLDDSRSAGCNSLIAEQMAQIVTSPEALASALGLGPRTRGAGGSWATGREGFRNALERRYGDGAVASGTGSAGAAALALGLAVYDQRGIGPEALSGKLGLPYPRVLELIALLEADGFLSTDLLRRCSAVWK